MTLAVNRMATAHRPLAKSEIKQVFEWTDGQPATELNFKFYCQATNEIAGISDEAKTMLRSFFNKFATESLNRVINKGVSQTPPFYDCAADDLP